MAEEKKKPTPVKPKKTSAVSETGERRVVLSAKTDPLAFLQEEKAKLTEQIEQGQKKDETLKEKVVPKEKPADEFAITMSRKEASREAELAWEEAKKQMAQRSKDSSFDWMRDDPVEEPEEEEEGIPISRAKRQVQTPAERRMRGYDRGKRALAVCLIFVAMFISIGGFVFDKLDLIQFDDGEKKDADE